MSERAFSTGSIMRFSSKLPAMILSLFIISLFELSTLIEAEWSILELKGVDVWIPYGPGIDK